MSNDEDGRRRLGEYEDRTNHVMAERVERVHGEANQEANRPAATPMQLQALLQQISGYASTSTRTRSQEGMGGVPRKFIKPRTSA